MLFLSYKCHLIWSYIYGKHHGSDILRLSSPVPLPRSIPLTDQIHFPWSLISCRDGSSYTYTLPLPVEICLRNLRTFSVRSLPYHGQLHHGSIPAYSVHSRNIPWKISAYDNHGFGILARSGNIPRYRASILNPICNRILNHLSIQVLSLRDMR